MARIRARWLQSPLQCVLDVEQGHGSVNQVGCEIKHLRRDEAGIANDVGVDLMPVVDPLFVRRKPGRRDRENFSVAERGHALWVFWRQLNIVLEYKELAMFWALHVEGCQQAAPVDDDVPRVLTEARDCALAFDIGPQAEAVVGKKREQSGKFGTDE